jgi:hypothetical protein
MTSLASIIMIYLITKVPLLYCYNQHCYSIENAAIHSQGLVPCIQDSLSTLNHISSSYIHQLCMSKSNHENLQQTMSDPAINHVRACNTELYHHTMLQPMCIDLFPRILPYICGLLHRQLTYVCDLFKGQPTYVRNYYHCKPHIILKMTHLIFP